MKITAIKKAVKLFTTAQLQEAEQALYEEQMPLIDIEGDDEGEKLTHVLAALEIKENMAKGMEFKEALRAYTQRVRNSIS